MTVKIPPQSLASEKVILASFLTIPDTVDDYIQDIGNEHFYNVKHNIIMSSIEALYGRSDAIDLVTVSNHIKSLNKHDMDEIDTLLSTLVSEIDTNRNLSTHIKIVREKYDLRKVIVASQEAMEAAYSKDAESSKIISNLDSAVLDIYSKSEKSEPEHVSKVVIESLKKVRNIKEGKVEPGYKTGFKELDDLTGGVREGELIILAARPSVGKTSLALSMSRNMKEPNAVFSLEMPKDQLGMKLKSFVSRVALFKIRNGFINDEEYLKLQQATNSISNLPIHIDDTPAINIIQLRGKVRKLIKKYGTKVVFIDYLQLMKAHKKVQSREQEIASISAALKELAKELKIAIIALSQLSRYVEQRKDSRPMLSDLRESGAIEQDADMVLFLYRGEIYEETPENKGVGEIIIGKQRNGPTTTVKVNFDKNTTLFYNQGDSPDPEERF